MICRVILRASLSFALLASVAPLTYAQVKRDAQAMAFNATGLIPIDPSVTIDTLSNGVTYYIRVNKKPENRAELRLVVRAGSILEDDDQRGLAHFVEHMAFNGTRNFAKNELVSYLESLGMSFGADVNASTSFDETVYMLQLPTDSAAGLAKGFQILDDWAHGQIFDTAEVRKERGVVIEEWRSGRGAGSRMLDKQLPVLLKNSRYAERLPIGTLGSLEKFTDAALKRFYTDWYRPELMAVVAVGDFDKVQIATMIEKHFSDIPRVRSPRARTIFPVPDHDSTLITIATDKEATSSSVAIYYKQTEAPGGTLGSYRREIVEQLYNRMLNQRLYELTQKAEAPFLWASSGQGPFVGPKEAYTIGAGVKDGAVVGGLAALLTEAERVDKFGFTPNELDREKREMLRSLERAFTERDKTESARYASEYASHFLDAEPSPGIAYEFETVKQILPGIALSDVNRLGREWITDRNRVIAVNAPDKADSKVPTSAELLAVFDSVRKTQIVAYADTVSAGPLIENIPKPGSISAQREIKDLGVTYWTLSNGVRVILKPTDFKADQVLVRAYSTGGNSLLSDRDITVAGFGALAVQTGGVGKFSQIDLQKALAGKLASVTPSISSLQEGMGGSASPKDLETLFQLINLYFTQPRQDSSAFLAFKGQVKANIANRGSQPEAVFGDTLQATLTQNHPRAQPLTAETVDSISLAKSMAFYRDRFADASDFTFVFVGNFAVDSIKPHVLTYLGSLPSLKRKETWRDVGIRYPTGVIRKVVRKGTEPKAQTQMVFTGPFTWHRANRYAMSSLTAVLRIRLREVLREDLGGVYGVSVGGQPSFEPRQEYSFSIGFGASPDRMDSLRAAVFAVIDSLKSFGPTAQDLEKVRETQRRGEETSRKENGFWLSTLISADRFGEDPHTLLNGEAMRATLSAEMIREAARKYLNTANYVQVTLLPEGVGK
ncbi:MAG: insulinase family protein [Gemmatimonadaceae bacterium]|nr:insulinase family protein [Gemmatimonadaceae bacterium]